MGYSEPTQVRYSQGMRWVLALLLMPTLAAAEVLCVRTRNGAHSVLEVADNGQGIPEELREQALERFVRLDPDRTTPGNGLGLSLVNAVAKLHDAQLELQDNAPGLKVTMTFRPPPAPPTPAAI